VVAIAACQRSDSTITDSASVGRTTSPGAARDTPVASTATCGISADTPLTGDGVGDLRVGATVETINGRCRVVGDTVAPAAEGSQERRLLVDLGRDTVIAVVDSNRVWRLHVATPAFKTTDSLGVGAAVSALRRPGARLLTGEGAYYVTLPGHCGLSFRLRGVAFGRASSLSQVPATASVDEVLVIGCSRSGG
jgi:hypothetical protein